MNTVGSLDDQEARAVIADLIEAGNAVGSGDAVLEAALTWLDEHRQPTPNQLRAVGHVLLYIWHDDLLGPYWMGQARWVKAFRAVGFVSDRDRSLPRRSLVVFRGANEAGRLGMAWSTSRSVALGHVQATSTSSSHPDSLVDSTRKLWRAVIPPIGVLARIEQRGEREVVVDPKYLRSVAEVGDG